MQSENRNTLFETTPVPRLGKEHGLEIEHKHGNREHFQKDIFIAYTEKEIAEKELLLISVWITQRNMERWVN